MLEIHGQKLTDDTELSKDEYEFILDYLSSSDDDSIEIPSSISLSRAIELIKLCINMEDSMSGAYECINECIDEIQQNKETISDDAKAVAHEFFFSNPLLDDVAVTDDDDEDEDYEEVVPRPDVSYYQQGGIEPIDFINSNDLNFNLGNVVKYITRAGKKDGADTMDDLKKAMDYLMFEQQKIAKENK